jgi:hypothetical protein
MFGNRVSQRWICFGEMREDLQGNQYRYLLYSGKAAL